MEEIFLGILSYAYFILVGGMFGLAALMPRMRALARQERRWRIGMLAVLSLLALGISFTFWSQSEINTEVSVLLGGDSSIAPRAGEVGQELWLRSVTPRFLQPECFSGEAEVCAIAAGMENPFRPRGSGLLPNLLRGLIAAAACAGTVWLLTNKKKESEPRYPRRATPSGHLGAKKR